MWKCIVFFESFKNGKRILPRDQIIKIVQKFLEDLEKIEVPAPNEQKESIGVPELQPNLDRQNVVRKVFIPALASPNAEFEKHIAGMFFIEYDALLDRIISDICFQDKKLIRSSPVRDCDVEKIISSVSQKIEEKSIKKGDVVEVIEGDYKGIIGRIEDVKDDIFFVHIQIFGCEQILNLSAEQIKIAEDL
jgi:hypothetical protein